MSRDEQHDLSFELERKHTMGLLLSAKNQRKHLRRTANKDEKSKENKTSSKKQIPKQSPKLASAKNAYMGASASKKSSKR